MSERLTTERETELRVDSASTYVPWDHREALAELLAEIDALRADLADAEAGGRTAELAGSWTPRTSSMVADLYEHLCDTSGPRADRRWLMYEAGRRVFPPTPAPAALLGMPPKGRR